MHVILGNCYSWTPAYWSTQIALAAASGVDGFILNIGTDTWQPDRVASAYSAALTQGSFKMALSFDMTEMSCGDNSK